MTQLSPLLIILLALFASFAQAGDDNRYDIAIANGRVIDPETGLDAIRHVGIKGDRIVAVSEQPLAAAQQVDASGLVVAPGFIDLHNHSATPLGLYYQAFDGVTSSLELEAGAYPLSRFASDMAAGQPLNIGASAGYAAIRMAVKADQSAALTLNHPAFYQPANAEERQQLQQLLLQSLDKGALGIGLPLDYMSEAVDGAELKMIFDIAGKRQVAIFVHIRRGVAGDPAGLIEVIEQARASHAPLHICHLQHNAMKNTGQFLSLIDAAKADGVSISTEMFPYNAGTTTIAAAVFKRNWQQIFDISYKDVEWAATGERFNKAMWQQYQQQHPDGMVIHHYVKEAWTQQVLSHPGVMVVTDGTPAISKDINVPPQGIGSFSRVLGRYSRELGLLDLPTAIKKMTLLPAQRLQSFAPVFARKGRIQVGADADITVFNPDTIIDNATYAEPFQASSGVEALLVNGRFVIRDGQFIDASLPGRKLSALSQ